MRHQKLFAYLELFLFLGLIYGCKMEHTTDKITLFVGTYTDNGSEGIYKYDFDFNTGELTNQKLAAKLDNPSFLAISPNQKMLYAVGELDNFIENSGSITTFRIKDSVLIKVDSRPTFGENPCYVEVSNDGKMVVVANYSGGNATIFETELNGNLKEAPQIVNHKLLDSTKTSHPHKTSFMNGELYVSDLGLGVIKKYTIENEEFVSSSQSELVLAAGAGPRHFEFSKDGNVIYVINELNSTVTVFKKEDGKYYAKQTLRTIANEYTGESYCADIHLSQDGNFLYGSNRGENTIVIFKVDNETGMLKGIGREQVRGNWPRNFSIDPTGNFLLVANQLSNNIVVYERDNESGKLKYLNQVALPSPVCLKFY